MAAGFGYADYDKKTPVTTNAVFAICSMSKTITAIAVMLAVQIAVHSAVLTPRQDNYSTAKASPLKARLSPVAADGKIYFTAENGNVYVVRVGPAFELLAINKMNETCMATPAISQGTLFFRTRHHLVAVAEKRL